jgi:hypothetical protein
VEKVRGCAGDGLLGNERKAPERSESETQRSLPVANEHERDRREHEQDHERKDAGRLEPRDLREPWQHDEQKQQERKHVIRALDENRRRRLGN